MSDIVYPDWFKLVTCVVLYRFQEEKMEFFMVERDDGKWGLSGGVGAFQSSSDIFDFTIQELNYDTNIRFNANCLYYLETIICDDRKTLITFFSYYLGNYKIDTNNWFSIEEIKRMNVKNEIMLDNTIVLLRFVNKMINLQIVL